MVKFIINYTIFVIATTLAILIIPIFWMIPLFDKKERDNFCNYWIWSEEQMRTDDHAAQILKRMHDLY